MLQAREGAVGAALIYLLLGDTVGSSEVRAHGVLWVSLSLCTTIIPRSTGEAPVAATSVRPCLGCDPESLRVTGGAFVAVLGHMTQVQVPGGSRDTPDQPASRLSSTPGPRSQGCAFGSTNSGNLLTPEVLFSAPWKSLHRLFGKKKKKEQIPPASLLTPPTTM